MASPRNDTPQTPSLNNPAVLDASTKGLLYELDDLTVPFEELAHAAQQCYDERLDSDVKNVARDKNRRKERADIESHLEYVQEQAAHLKQRREAIISRIPAHLLVHARGSADLAEAELDAVLLEIEKQKLTGVLIMSDHIYDEIIGTEVDIKSIQDPNTRTELTAALGKFRDALSEFRAAFSHHGAKIRKAINRELMDLEARRSGYGRSPELPQSPELLHDGDDDEIDDSSSSSADTTAVASSLISDLKLGSPVAPVKEEVDDGVRLDVRSEDDGMFRFERDHPPSLSRLANWLGLDDSAVDVALLLNTWPIQHAFRAYRTTAGQSCAGNPERLRFLERSSEAVAWERVSGDIANLGDYELARRHWAVVLQMFWFMEKAFGNVN